MKKEALSVMTVKTLLAVLLFAGMGTIIVGGGCIIWEYSKKSNNQFSNNNKILNPTNECLGSNSKFCDRDCQADSDCKYTCGCSAINKNEMCDDEGIIYDCVDHYVRCEKGECVLGEEKLLNQPNTSNWQTYRNEEFGFEVKYPNIYNIITPPQLSEYQKNQGIAYLAYLKHSDVNASISVQSTNINFDLQDIKQRFAPTGNESFPEQVIAEQNTFYFYGPDGGGVSYPDNYFYNLNGKILIISFDGPYVSDKTPSDETKQLESQILSSFKFIETEKIDTSNWQTYRNEEFGFEVKYPEEWKTEEGLPQKNMYFNPPTSGDYAGNFISFYIALNIDNISLEDYIKGHVSSKGVTSNVQIAGIQGVRRVFYDDWSDTHSAIVLFIKDSKIFIFNATKEASIFDQIISSFKFTNQNTSIADIIKEDKEIKYLEDFNFQNLPDYVFQEQKGETYKLENYIFQFIRQRNLNTPLPISDNNFKWAGVLYSENNGLSWDDFFVIDNPIDHNGDEVKYNPAGMFVKNNKLYLDISDDRGAGSGEGNLLRYYTEEGEIWVRDTCLYLIPEFYFINKLNGSNGIEPFPSSGNSNCVYSPVSLCDDEPFGTAIGSNVYPIDLKYKKLHFLGQLFTAANCGEERLNQIFGVDGENYILGSAINLKNDPSQELVNVFKSIGFSCYDKLPDNECKEWSLNNYSIEISELLKLEPHHNNFSSDDCANCG